VTKLTELRDVPRTWAEAEFFRSASGNYYHKDRTHLGLAKDTSAGRSIAIRSPSQARFNPSHDSADCTIVTQ